jgi:hypothetical protein
MKTVLNKTRGPLKVHLSQGRVLHLGPAKTGQISVHDADRGSVKKLVEAGQLEVLDEGRHVEAGGGEASGRPNSHGHHPSFAVKKRGER